MREDKMPIAARHPCASTSCKAVVHTKYCTTHQHLQTKYNSEYSRVTRGTTTEQGYGTTWQKVRLEHLSKHPLCVACGLRGIDRAANQVHHKVSLRQGGSNEDDNLMSLCKSCHSRITRLGDKRNYEKNNTQIYL